MDPLAPPVVAVVVTRDPGSWFEETLEALGSQDYPNLSVLVLDAASATDPTPRVAAALPTAYVKRLEDNPGYGGAANEAIGIVEGASHFVFCHDDVAPEPDAVRLMLEEAFRSNAGVVAPKLVSWDDESRLLQVGMGADKVGAPSTRVEPGELDQEQHDAVRDVFVAPGGFTLVRADLFETLEGFDAAIFLFGEDLDFCWRAAIAGARVVVAPGAAVRHREASARGERAVEWPDGRTGPPLAQYSLQRRHELRAVFKNYSLWHLVRVVPQLLVLSIFEILAESISGRSRQAAAVVRAWRWNVARANALRGARKAVAAQRLVPDHDVRRLQSRGSARLSRLVRSQLARGERGLHLAPRATGARPRGAAAPFQLSVAVWSAIAVVLVFGSRHLIGEPFPLIGQLDPFPSWSSFLHQFAGGWRHTGVGSEAPAPSAFALLGLGGAVFLGGMGLLQSVLVLGSLPLGALGAWRLARPLGSARGRLVATVVYLAVPLAYDYVAAGRFEALIVYASAPWILGRLLFATDLVPFGEASVRAGQRSPQPARRRLAWRCLSLGLLLSPVVALAPGAAVATAVAAVGISLAALVAGHRVAASRVVILAAGALAVAFVLLFPWSLDFFHPSSQVASVAGWTPGGSGAPGFGALLRFQLGPLGNGPVGWAFVVVALVPLLIGRGWRLGSSLRLWGAALAVWVVAWLSGRGWLGSGSTPAELLLPMAAAAIALSGALAFVAFERDLPGYRFGWRHGMAALLGVFVAIGTVPVLASSVGGRWNLPLAGFEQSLGWMSSAPVRGGFRVLWLGDPRALPLGSWQTASGLGYATSESGLPDATDLWPSANPGDTTLMADLVGAARAGGTARLGHLLAPFGVRYLVVVEQGAPAASTATGSSTGPGALQAPGLVGSLLAQDDLRRLSSDPSVVVLQNTAFAPERAALSATAAAASRRGLGAALFTDLAASHGVLHGGPDALSFSGSVPAGTVSFSAPYTDNWVLTGRADGALDSHRSFGWATSYSVPAGQRASLAFRTSPWRGLAIALEVALWLVVAGALLSARWTGISRRRASRRTGPGTAVLSPAPPPSSPHEVGVEGPVPTGDRGR
jgi:GT2 family glycosyltransferase